MKELWLGIGETRSGRLAASRSFVLALAALAALRPGLAQAGAPAKGPATAATRPADKPKTIDALLAEAKAKVKAGKFASAVSTLDELLRRDPRHAEARRLRRPLAKYDPRWWIARAVAEAKSVPASPEEVSTHTMIAAVQAAADNQGGYVAAMRTARSAADQIPDAEGKWNAYTEIVCMQAMSGDFRGALATAGAIQERLVRFAAFSTIVRVRTGGLLSLPGQQPDRQDVADAKKMVDAWPEPEDRSKLYVDIAAAEAETGDFAAAKATAAAIGGPADRCKVYCQIAKAQAEAGKPAAARQTMRLAATEAQAVKKDLFRAWAWRKVAIAQAEAGQIAAALATVAKITDLGDDYGIHCAIAKAQAKAGDRDAARRSFQKARELAARIEDYGDWPSRSRTYLAIAKAQADAGDVAGAWQTFRLARAAKESLTRERYHAASWIASATIRAEEKADRAGRIRRARLAAGSIRDPLEKATTYLALASAELKRDEKPAAREDLRQALAAAERIRNAADREAAFRYLAAGYAELGLHPKARATAGMIKDKKRRSWAWTFIGGVQTRLGDFDAARATAAGIEDAEQRDTMCLTVAERQAQSGSIEGLEQWIRAFPTPRLRATAFAAVANGLVKAREDGK